MGKQQLCTMFIKGHIAELITNDQVLQTASYFSNRFSNCLKVRSEASARWDSLNRVINLGTVVNNTLYPF